MKILVAGPIFCVRYIESLTWDKYADMKLELKLFNMTTSRKLEAETFFLFYLIFFWIFSAGFLF